MQQIDTTNPAPQQPVRPTTVDTTPAYTGLHSYMEHQPVENNQYVNHRTIETTVPADVTPAELSRPFYFYDTTFLHDPTSDIETTEVLPSLDSLFLQAEWSPQKSHQSIFVGHELPTRHHTATHKTDGDVPGWIFCSLIAVALFICFFLNRTRLKLSEMFGALFNQRSMARLFREHNISNGSRLITGGIIYMLEFALLSYYIVNTQTSGMNLSGPLTLLMLAAVFLGGYLLKLGFNTLLGQIFENSPATKAYNSNTYLFNTLGSIILLPILLLTFYNPHIGHTCGWLSLSFISIWFIIRLLRCLQLILTYPSNSRIYLFSYLCMSEIVPLLIAAKTLISY